MKFCCTCLYYNSNWCILWYKKVYELEECIFYKKDILKGKTNGVIKRNNI